MTSRSGIQAAQLFNLQGRTHVGLGLRFLLGQAFMGLICEFAEECTVRRARLDGVTQYPKRKGELAELAFVFKAASFGLAISQPFGDSFAYDLVVESGDGRMLRIQVKSAFTTHRWGYMINLGARGHAFGRSHYTAADIDFVVAYIVAEEAWYIIPVEAIAGRKQIRLYPSGTGKNSGGHFEIYREAWHLITGKPSGL
jgi:hypothetical protein